ncbi:hypothetical protein [Streptomyces sp. NPDC091416]|uniref:hypothetical protein n=1 Tax=Streptomyces sp. NPDC091416 TaxID=3366003 RepID=UPI003802DCE5
MKANERLPGGTAWNDARKSCQNFALCTWIIQRVGAATDPDWDPEALAADTLAVLILAPDRALSLSTGRHDLLAERIGELRRHKNMTAHVNQLVHLIPSEPTKDQLSTWIDVRKYLP